ncbi:TetR/AcrR family transcriptional regulator [Actinomadura graeca]|uniref:TetR/AcrR family transcriptional regulator n=2 Tax=Actinomadura graeca TaxID=2750812 RepID=A0ABX8R8B7_9ACTN|nr:TetR/AcrR family transcriptional regulator [Actinomadura graeca]
MGEDAPEETTWVRIRDAALAQFAEHGERGATIRGIAKAAEVSPALVQHYFGTKESLRQACDEYAIEVFRRAEHEALDGGMGDPGFMAVAMRAGVAIRRYLARVLVDGSPRAAALFDDAVALNKELLQRDDPGMSKPTTDDLHAYSAVMMGMGFGLVVLHEHMSRVLGADTLSPAGYRRLALAALDVHMDVLLSEELAEQARASLKDLPDDET